MKRKKIIIFARSLPFHGLGGMEIVAWDLATTFSRMSQDVTIVTTSLEGRDEVEIIEGVKVVFLKETKPGKYTKDWWYASRRYFENNLAIDAGVVFSVSAAGISILKSKKKYPDIKFVMQAHGTSWGEIKSKWKSFGVKNILSSIKNIFWLAKDMGYYNNFNYIVAVGPRVVNDLTSFPINLTLSDNKVKLISNGIDTSIFSPERTPEYEVLERLGIPKDAKIIISASRLHPQKGFYRCINVFEKILKKNPNSYYLIAGDGTELSNLQKQAELLGVQQNVFFLGRLKRDELAIYLRLSSVFLFLTEHMEGLPLNVLEAVSTGLPVVVSEHLSLFDSSAIHKVSLADDDTIASVTLNLIDQNNLDGTDSLPAEYSLHESARKYLSLFEK